MDTPEFLETMDMLEIIDFCETDSKEIIENSLITRNYLLINQHLTIPICRSKVSRCGLHFTRNVENRESKGIGHLPVRNQASRSLVLSPLYRMPSAAKTKSTFCFSFVLGLVGVPLGVLLTRLHVHGYPWTWLDRDSEAILGAHSILGSTSPHTSPHN